MSKIKHWLAGGLLLIAVLLFFRLYLKSREEMGQALDSRQSVLQALGKHLSLQHAPDCVLVLSNPFAQKHGQQRETRQFDDAGIEGLKKGLAKTTRLEVARPKIKPEYWDNPQSAPIPPNAKNPLSFLMEASSIDAISKNHPDCEVIVSLIGLPVGANKLKVWQKRSPVKFAFLLPDLRVVGSKAEVLRAFQSGKIIAAAVRDLNSGEPLIIDADNIQAALASHPGLLGFHKKR